MRLLNVITLKLETFNGPDVPKYAALSHTWGDEEVTFQDIMAGSGVGKIGWIKIIRSAAEAEKHGCKYIWIDTCCIDKTSSAELSEAINSMFRWYRKCQICFAHLDGVKLAPKTLVIVLEVDSEPITPGASPITQPPSPRSTPSSFSKARWFERGWTLQELIAPSTLYFYDSGWAQIGEKKELSKE
ncbi:HET-domain-containing protein, partial [Bimuria novae-zelandiae CBS 107.79]